MTDKRTIKPGSKQNTDRLKRPVVKQKHVNKFITHVEDSDKNNTKWQTLQRIITETACE
jgi:hypothetical protein